MAVYHFGTFFFFQIEVQKLSDILGKMVYLTDLYIYCRNLPLLIQNNFISFKIVTKLTNYKGIQAKIETYFPKRKQM